jgi:hypothetical protein
LLQENWQTNKKEKPLIPTLPKKPTFAIALPFNVVATAMKEQESEGELTVKQAESKKFRAFCIGKGCNTKTKNPCRCYSRALLLATVWDIWAQLSTS